MMKVASREYLLELQRFTEFYASKYFLLVVLALGALFILLPGILREDSLMIGDESFYHLRIANEIVDNGFFNYDYDELSFSGRDNFMELGVSYFIAGISLLSGMDVETSGRLLFFFFGLGSLLLCYSLLKRFNAGEGMFALTVIAISPGFVYLFSIVNRFAMPVFLSLLLGYLFLKKKYILSAISLLLIPFFSYAFTVFVLIVLAITLLYLKKKKLILFILLVVLFGWLFTLNVPNNYDELISDFGYGVGVSIFGVFLALFGLSILLKKKGFTLLYSVIVLLFLSSLKFPWIILVLTFPFSLLVSLNLLHIINMKWESGFVKELTVLLLVCGLLFSGISYAKSLSEGGPDKELFNALSKLPRGSVVLSHHSSGYWINYAGMKNVMDSFTQFKGFEERRDDVDFLFYTRDLSKAIGILDKYNVDFILITQDMRHGLVWSEDEQGLLFLLKYSDKFKRVYDDGVEIWKYNRKLFNVR